mgnify:CR=1 FL=1
MTGRLIEDVDRHWGQFFDVDRTLYDARSAYQDIRIIENRIWGRVLLLDGVVQTTSADEHRYHEALVHVPMLSLSDPRRVLIVGGGDGGTAREVLRHPVDRVVMVEIDDDVVNACRTHMPDLANGAFDDPRLDLKIGDGVAFLAQTDEQFDIILIDSTDPGDETAPGGVLFTDAFYADAARVLSPDGLVVAQHAIPFLDGPIHRAKLERLARAFSLHGRFDVPVPTYTGGPLSLGWGSHRTDPGRSSIATLRTRFDARGLETRFYTPERHGALFALSADDGVSMPPASPE